jgi:thioredoxin 1
MTAQALTRATLLRTVFVTAALAFGAQTALANKPAASAAPAAAPTASPAAAPAATPAAAPAAQTAAVEQPYNKADFDKALASGKPVAVDFHAVWCPTCKVQKPLVMEILREPRMKDFTLFIANYDTESDLKKALRVRSQSTFVIFRGGKEVGRSTGQTKKEELAALFTKGL